MTHTSYNKIHKLIKDNFTVKQLKALNKVHKLEAQSTNPRPLKSDYVDASMDLLVELDNTSPSGFNWHRYYLLHVVFFPTIKDELLGVIV